MMSRKIKGKQRQKESASLPRREGLERVTADLTRLLHGQDFRDIDEVNDFIKKVMPGRGPVPRSSARSALEQSQDLAYDAWEASTPEKAAELARKALAMSPDCADAFNILAEMETKSIHEKSDLYRQGVEAGKRALGTAFFEENKGHFWGMIETRPYMRARQGLAECLWELGKEEEAINHYEALLELNPNDNQGIRDLLLGCYLKRGDDTGPARLYKEYADDVSATFVWTKVLVEFRRDGPLAASRVLPAAIKGNPHVPKFLCGRKKMPFYLPEMYGWGDENEAVIYAANFAEAWLANPGTLLWLKNQTEKPHSGEKKLH